MKIAVLINGKAGRANSEAIRTAVDHALFRAEIQYFTPTTPAELQEVAMAQAKSSDALIVCGGDGTLNTAVQPLLRNRLETAIPPILPLPVGTANDLASGLGVSRRLERAARLIFETEPKRIDVIEVRAGSKVVFMLTNGGFGVTAKTADLANEIRQSVKEKAKTHAGYEWGHKILQLAGSRIYEFLLAGQLLKGKSADDSRPWKVSIEIDGGITRETSAPFIMVNNQPGLGGSYVPAPLTSNTDGTFNILLVDSYNLIAQTRALLQIRNGGIPNETICPRLETRRAVFRASPDGQPLTFFGDGEILQKNVSEVELICVKRALPVYYGDTQ